MCLLGRRPPVTLFARDASQYHQFCVGFPGRPISTAADLLLCLFASKMTTCHAGMCSFEHLLTVFLSGRLTANDWLNHPDPPRNDTMFRYECSIWASYKPVSWILLTTTSYFSCPAFLYFLVTPCTLGQFFNLSPVPLSGLLLSMDLPCSHLLRSL